MRNVMTKILSGFSLTMTVLLMACGSNNCPSGQTMYNGVCTATNGAYGGNCQAGQLYTQYGCLQTNVNGCMQTSNMAWSPQMNSCVPGTQSGYQTGYQNGYGSCTAGQVNTQYGCLPQGGCRVNYGYLAASNMCIPATTQTGYGNNNCQPGYVFTQSYGCMIQGSCQGGMGMTPYGCSY